jgi:hypothetical protein
VTTTALPRPIDPFAGSRNGRYEDDAVVVLRRDELTPGPTERWTTVTAHFALGRDRGRLVVVHALAPGAVDNDVAGLLDGELFAPGWASGADTFERLLTGIVLSCHDDALTAWEGFYRTTLDRLAELDAGLPTAPAGSAAPEGSLAGFAPVYRRAEELVRDAVTQSLLDLGTCFGFFPLRLAGRPPGPAGERMSVRAADISASTCDLLGRVSHRLGSPLPVLVCDAACVPLPTADVDTVTLLHVLEHVDAGHGAAILAEAVRLARRRIVIGVPLEPEPDAAFGHLRSISLADLAEWGAGLAAGGPWRARVEEHHGGWLVLDRLLPVSRRPG